MKLEDAGLTGRTWYKGELVDSHVAEAIQAYLTQDMREHSLSILDFERMRNQYYQRHMLEIDFQWRIRVPDFEAFLEREKAIFSPFPVDLANIRTFLGYPIVWLRGEHRYVASLEGISAGIGLLDSGELEWKDSQYV